MCMIMSQVDYTNCPQTGILRSPGILTSSGKNWGVHLCWPGKHRMDFHFSFSSVKLLSNNKISTSLITGSYMPESKIGHIAFLLHNSVSSSIYWIVGWWLHYVISGETTSSKDTCDAATIMRKLLMKTHKGNLSIPSNTLSFPVQREALWSIKFSWSQQSSVVTSPSLFPSLHSSQTPLRFPHLPWVPVTFTKNLRPLSWGFYVKYVVFYVAHKG